MSRFNTRGVKARTGATPITSTTTAAVNDRGGVGFTRDPKGELFLLGISNLLGVSKTEKDRTFHENRLARDARWAGLIGEIAVSDAAWLQGFFPWLRAEANMRSAPLTGSLIATKAMLAAGITGSRVMVRDSILRADEPGEAIAFWFETYGRKLPKPVKRGIADATKMLYTERALLKYDTASHGVRFADVIQLVHAKPKTIWQSDLFKHALDRRYGNTEAEIPAILGTVWANKLAKQVDVEELSADEIKGAGMTWENTISRATDKKAAWEKQIPSMNYMALLRNLRNFDEAGVSDEVAQTVIAKLTDPDQVRRSRQFPFRFLSAYDELSSLRWAQALETAINLSLSNMPELSGRTLIAVDQSGSMFGKTSADSKRTWAEVAMLFGTGLAIRNRERATLVQYGTTAHQVGIEPGAALLKILNFVQSMGGTDTATMLSTFYKGHDRVVLITDEQHQGTNPSTMVPANIPLYTFNLVGYRVGSMGADPNRVTLGGGLTDAAFKVIPLLEAGRDGTWPWEEKASE